MIHFHLCKYWFDLIKSGEKTSEYRFYNIVYENLLRKEMENIRPCIKFYSGYPAKDDVDRIIVKYIEDVSLVKFIDLPDNERKFFDEHGYYSLNDSFYKIDLYDC